MLGAPTESTWPGFSALPNATAVRWKAQAHSRLRDAFPNASFAGKPQLSHTGFQLLSGLLALDPARRTGALDALEHEVGFSAPNPQTPESPESATSHASAGRLSLRVSLGVRAVLQGVAAGGATVADDDRPLARWCRAAVSLALATLRLRARATGALGRASAWAHTAASPPRMSRRVNDAEKPATVRKPALSVTRGHAGTTARPCRAARPSLAEPRREPRSRGLGTGSFLDPHRKT